MPDLDEPVNIDAEPEDALRVLLASPPLAGDESEDDQDGADESAEDE
ncbi:MAG: hypothetical protein M0Z69_11975 [Actinomycetota bacterium]|nr:hypothetical protein [Actinomycetota bacterium]